MQSGAAATLVQRNVVCLIESGVSTGQLLFRYNAAETRGGVRNRPNRPLKPVKGLVLVFLIGLVLGSVWVWIDEYD